MKPLLTPAFRANRFADLFAPAIVDIFAGFGGWSIGEEQALTEGGYNRGIDLMINHWQIAVDVHQANHPLTEHLRANVLEVDPDDVLPGRRIAHLHASPDCTDHSKAKGGKPRRKEIRALADVVIVWAGKRRPSVITLENVEEFQQWGPLLEDGQPDKTRRGDEFRRWKRELEALGYVVEHRELRACDYGAPTTRKRLFVIARCDGLPIVWPKPTHGKPGTGLKPYRTAAECIDWSIPMLSIFATPEEARAFSAKYGGGVPRRPLKAKTLERIARGLDKFVLKSGKPFIVDIQNYGWNSTTVRDVSEPMPTVTGGPKGGGFAAVDVSVAPYTVPNLGERDGQLPRCGSIEQPLPTVTGAGTGARLVAATLSTLNHGGPEHRAQSPAEPLATVTGANDARALVSALLSEFGHVGERWGESSHDLRGTMGTVTGSNNHGVTCAYLSQLYGTNKGSNGDVQQPAPTISGGGLHTALVAAFMSTYYGNTADGNPMDEPAPTVVGKDRIQLVTVTIDGQTYVVTDIAMRMLTPRELARAQGFDDSYIIDRTADGRRISKADQVKLIGNSVPPAFSRAIVKANIVDSGVLDEMESAASA